MWFEERSTKQYKATKPRFSTCCSQGRVDLAAYKKPPSDLQNLFHDNDPISNTFRQNIRSFNSMFAFTSMGGRTHKDVNVGGAPPVFVLNGENYHQIGSLLPTPATNAKFAQLYIHDTDNEISNRMSAVGYVSY